MREEIRYQALWGRLYITLGILFILIFILGILILDDITLLFNIVPGALMVIIGKTMLKKPYAVYNGKEIIMYSYFGSIRKHYTFKSIDDINVKSNHFYLNGKKLKMNVWFLNKVDWERAKKFYGATSNINDELVDS